MADSSHAEGGVGTETQYIAGGYPGATVCTEALEGALPQTVNSPQICPYGLYSEQLSGTAFTQPRATNQRAWLYRILPSVVHGHFEECREQFNVVSDFDNNGHASPQQIRWMPHKMPEGDEAVDFVHGIVSMGGCGSAAHKDGLAIHHYACSANMEDTSFMNSDGDFLILPQTGTLHIQTEMGFLHVKPKELVVLQRGIHFAVKVDGPSRGYILELFQGHLKLPDLGPIGANGLANPRDFEAPVAAYDDRQNIEFKIINKHGGQFFEASKDHSVFNVVAWHGNYFPYKYDMSKFNTMNSVSYDHPDPSIYTVLTCQTNEPGLAVCDFVIFPPRWMCMENSFRPPYYHRNTMSEYMGLIDGHYDAKLQGANTGEGTPEDVEGKPKGFLPGGASLHNCMEAHGPDDETFRKASTADTTVPEKFEGGLAFMFETNYQIRLTDFARGENNPGFIDEHYTQVWQTLPRLFDPTNKNVTAQAFENLQN
jgi:homogentisate 1,2-dioxygenase